MVAEEAHNYKRGAGDQIISVSGGVASNDEPKLQYASRP